MARCTGFTRGSKRRRDARRVLLLLVLLLPAPTAAQTAPATAAEPAAEPSRFWSEEDGWLDASGFLDEAYGFLPIVVPITEPAVGYGAAAGVAFISDPLRDAQAGFGRPNITLVGGLGTDNGSWGAAAGDVRHWLDDRLETQVGLFYTSVNLDFHGIGADAGLADDPLRYELEPKGGVIRAKYRLGDSPAWIGLGYAYAATRVAFDAPAGTPGLPDFQRDSRVAGFTPSLTYDSRDNLFTPTRGTFVEALVGVFSDALGGDGDFQRVQLTGLEYLRLRPRWYLGLRIDVAASFGHAPFYLRPYLSTRGVEIMRYQGEEIAQAELELRWQFWQRFSLLGFAGGGAAWNDFEHFDDSEALASGGVGFRYELARKYGIHAGLDVAFGPDNTAVYVQVGSAWARP